MNLSISPVVRVSFGLLMLTLSILFVGDWFGLIPQASKIELEHRKDFSETMAIQFSSLAMTGEIKHIRTVLHAVVDRHDDVESAAFRTDDGDRTLEAGDHSNNRVDSNGDAYVKDLVVVPIFRGNERWGSVEVKFKPGEASWLPGVFDNSFLMLLAFVGTSGFVMYLLFMKRVLRQLDPSQVIPHRVKAAFDSLAEGVLILDEAGNIVLANRAFTQKSSVNAATLLGVNAGKMNWSPYRGKGAVKKEHLPWNRVLKTGNSFTGDRLTIHSGAQIQRSYTVNCTPIKDDKDNIRGVITTFDDLTELEKRNDSLNETLVELKKSKTAVDLKSKELEYLATRDPLTNCLNRRAFGERYLDLFMAAREQQKNLICVMIDIDHFKLVNDNHGHAVGDKVIKFLADTVHQNIRQNDLLARYGGEEFCLILDDSSVEQAAEIAERMRVLVGNGDPNRYTSTLQISASFGVATLNDSIKNQDELVNFADKALYQAKETGRNKVVIWDHERANVIVNEATAKAAQKEPKIASSPSKNKTSSITTLVIPDEKAKAQDTITGAGGNVIHVHDRIKELERVAKDKAEQLDRYFTHDSLTELPTRSLFVDRVAQALLRAKRKQCVSAVLSLGLEDLGRINDTLGYEQAQAMLRETAARLDQVLRAQDTVTLMSSEDEETTISKLNDGEFGILLGSASDTESITWVVKRIFDELQRPFHIDGHTFNIHSNIGIGVYPTDGTDATELIKKASIGRYYAEQLPGHNNVEYFSEHINQMSKEQVHIESQLSDAISNEEFVVYYQSKLDLNTSEICGFEALVRWQHPRRGILPPNEFIDVAERTRLINTIGEWVLRESCRQLIAFEQATSRELTMAVNISPVQLSQSDLVESVLSILEETGVAPEKLELELTESCLVENLDTALQTLTQLQAVGIKISVDDFGTGYSALSYLRSLPVDCLKIDRCFVTDIDNSTHDQAIIAAIINMAQALELTVVAEGVETPSQLAALTDLKCDYAQGYLLSKPIPADKAIELLLAPDAAAAEKRVG